METCREMIAEGYHLRTALTSCLGQRVAMQLLVSKTDRDDSSKLIKDYLYGRYSKE